MKLSTALRTPYRPRSIVGSDTARWVREVGLRRAIVVTRTVIATLCAARAATDWLHGHATFEGGVALVLVIAFTVWLAAEAVRGAIRASALPQWDSPYRSAMDRSAGAPDGRTS
jgi:hypothetical protein